MKVDTTASRPSGSGRITTGFSLALLARRTSLFLKRRRLASKLEKNPNLRFGCSIIDVVGHEGFEP
ncbi:MAG: hypothetical protein KDI83_12960, partial [Gammaproteobacteria bacterium]|nr:hypothetical protein [Gammaproteobacteria bacterium]